MFGISFYELLVILIVLLILFRPSEFTTILYNVALVIKKIKFFFTKVGTELDQLTDLGDLKGYEIKEKVKVENLNTKNKKHNTHK